MLNVSDSSTHRKRAFPGGKTSVVFWRLSWGGSLPLTVINIVEQGVSFSIETHITSDTCDYSITLLSAAPKVCAPHFTVLGAAIIFLQGKLTGRDNLFEFHS